MADDFVHSVRQSAQDIIAKTTAMQKYLEEKISRENNEFVPRVISEKDILELFGKLMKDGVERQIDNTVFRCEREDFRQKFHFYLPSEGAVDLVCSENCQQNQVFVSNNPKQVVLWDFSGKLLWTISLRESPESITHTPEGYLLMSNFKQHEIQSIRKQDSGPKTFLFTKPLSPLGIYCESDGSLLVCLVDKFDFTPTPKSKRLVRRYTNQGTVLNSIENYLGRRLYSCPFRVYGGYSNRVHVIDITSSNNARIVVTSREGQLVFSFNNGGLESFCPSALCVDSEGFMFVTESLTKALFSIDKDGRLINKFDIFAVAKPTALSVSCGHHIVVGFENNQVAIFYCDRNITSPTHEVTRKGETAVSAL
jgi:hypothetical protein